MRAFCLVCCRRRFRRTYDNAFLTIHFRMPFISPKQSKGQFSNNINLGNAQYKSKYNDTYESCVGQADEGGRARVYACIRLKRAGVAEIAIANFRIRTSRINVYDKVTRQEKRTLKTPSGRRRLKTMQYRNRIIRLLAERCFVRQTFCLRR